MRRKRAAGAELDSQGALSGAIQVPPDEIPVVLGPDHATMGGYPVLGVVVSADLCWLGQCAPGDRIVLWPITHAEADEAWDAYARQLASAVVGRYPLTLD